MTPEASKYFKLNLKGQSPRMIVNQIGEVDLRIIELDMAERLWKRNFPYIELTEAGTQKYIKGIDPEKVIPGQRMTIPEILEKIVVCTCTDEVIALKLYAKNNTRVAKAARERLAELKK